MSTTGAIPEEYVRRNRAVGDLRDELKARGRKWGDARAWGLAQIENGTRPAWRPAHMPPQSPNPDVIEAYLDHLDSGGQP